MDAKQYQSWMAAARLRNAFRDPDYCEICGAHRPKSGRPLVAHHWRGYDYPEDVWWLCDKCHCGLRDRHVKHDGQTTLEAVRAMLQLPVRKSPSWQPQNAPCIN